MLSLASFPQLLLSASIDQFGPVSHWTCDEVSGVRFDSNVNNNNDLTDNNTVGSAVGLLGNACDFEYANSEWLSISDASQVGLDLSGDFTLSIWVKRESDVQTQLMGKRDGNLGSNGRAYNLFIDALSGTSLDSNISNGGTDVWKGVTWAPSLATWYHLVMVYTASAGSGKFYVNGTQVGTTQTGYPTTVYNNTIEFALGVNGGTHTLYYDGLMDEITVISSALNGSEVAILYNSGTPLPYTQPAELTNPKLIPYNDDMPRIESINCPDATCTLQYATTTDVYLTAPTMLLFFVVSIFVLMVSAYLAYKFL